MVSESLPSVITFVQTLRSEGINNRSIETILGGMGLPTGLQQRVETLFGLTPKKDSSNSSIALKDQQPTYQERQPIYPKQSSYP